MKHTPLEQISIQNNSAEMERALRCSQVFCIRHHYPASRELKSSLHMLEAELSSNSDQQRHNSWGLNSTAFAFFCSPACVQPLSLALCLHCHFGGPGISQVWTASSPVGSSLRIGAPGMTTTQINSNRSGTRLTWRVTKTPTPLEKWLTLILVATDVSVVFELFGSVRAA